MSVVPVAEFKSWTENATFPLLPDASSAAIFRQMHLESSPDEAHIRVRPYAELHATNDKHLLDFDEDTSKVRIPVFGGSSFNLWDPDFAGPWAWVKDSESFHELMREKYETGKRQPRSPYFQLQNPDVTVPYELARVAYRWITNQTNTRTTIVCLIPPGTPLVNSAPTLVIREGGVSAEAFMLGVMSSIPFDWAARRLVEGNLTFEVLRDIPTPWSKFNTALGREISRLAGSLACIDERFESWARDLGVPVGSLLKPDERAAAEARLDALVAHAYCLTVGQVRHIFETFHRSTDYSTRLELVLEHFDSWKDKS